jgi:Protein of unknown function (DUF2852)
MWWSYWPTTWFFFAPIMMLACMAGMFLMMRGMHGRYHPKSTWTDINVDGSGPHVAAHFPQRLSPFEEDRAETPRRLDQEQKDFQDFVSQLRTPKDKAEFDEFMAQRHPRATSPPNTAVEGGSHGR